MHIDIIIPTFDRSQLLKRTIATLRAQSYPDFNIIVVIDGNLGMAVELAELPILMILNKQRMDWVASMNKAIQFTHRGAMVYASDDLEFSKDCLQFAIKELQTRAPDTDALIAIEQDVKGCSTAFGLLGRKFINRFPQGQVFCPDYTHYGGDSELGRFANSIGRLYMCPEAKVIHHRAKDLTYKLAKPIEQQDFKYIRERRNKGLLWGKTFERLHK